MEFSFEKMFCNQNEKPLEYRVTDGGFASIFRTIGCVGDSLSSGEFESVDENGNHGYHDMFEYSWGQFLGRICGSTVLNFSRGGMTAKFYCESFADSMGYWDPKNACQCYIIALGINDLFGQKQEIGSIDDVDTDDYNNNKKTFAGYYAKIIQRLKKIQPRAKFFLMTMMNDAGSDEQHRETEIKHRTLLLDFAKLFDNTYVLDFYTYAPEYNGDFRKKFYLCGHLNPMGYRLTAEMVASYMDYIIRHNAEDFKEICYIGTEMHG